jgi:serine/threonine protein kinase
VLDYEVYGDLSNFMKLLKKSTLSESLIAYIAVQILKGLDFCHKNKIAHLDIKKQNILVNEDLNLKLCDFSVSAEYGDNDIILHKVGSSVYISPENLNRILIPNNQISKVDVYSLGVLLYNLAFKSYPYGLGSETNSDIDKITSKVNSSELKIPSVNNYSLLFKDFLYKSLQKDFNKRLSIEDSLNHDWIKSGMILLEEKEKINNKEKFLIMLVTDNFFTFNKMIQCDR